jgi:hypothetical protein
MRSVRTKAMSAGCGGPVKVVAGPTGSSALRRPRADEQHVVVAPSDREDARRRRAEGGATSVDVLHSGILVGRPVGAGPEPIGRAGPATVHVTAEGDRTDRCTAGEEHGELGALRVVRSRTGVRATGAQVGRAHGLVQTGGQARPPTLLQSGLCREGPVRGRDDGCPSEDRVPEQPPAGRTAGARRRRSRARSAGGSRCAGRSVRRRPGRPR